MYSLYTIPEHNAIFVLYLRDTLWSNLEGIELLGHPRIAVYDIW